MGLKAQERLLIAELGISASEFMFEETRTYVKQREAFRKTVAHIQKEDTAS